MTKFDDIPLSSVEICESPEDKESGQFALARRLEESGHKTIALDRAIAVVERVSASDLNLPDLPASELLKISLYSDPDVSGEEQPMCLYIQGSKWGFSGAFLRTNAPGGSERIFKLEEIALPEVSSTAR